MARCHRYSFISAHRDYGLKTEEQVKRLVTDISRVVEAAEPAKRAGLKELAATLLHEEITTISEVSQAVKYQPQSTGTRSLVVS